MQNKIHQNAESQQIAQAVVGIAIKDKEKHNKRKLRRPVPLKVIQQEINDPYTW